ncbi:MAG: hypothetical protein C0501_26775 [Isosphaera sp.]|nr:hypothetical protein [Isosphaera sp.]
MRSGFECPACRMAVCSEGCLEKHWKASHAAEQQREAEAAEHRREAHAAERRRREAEAAQAELEKENERRSRELDAKIAELKELQQQQGRVADAAARELKRIRRLMEQEAAAAAAKVKKRNQLRAAVEEATRLLDARLAAWQQAGSPVVEQAELGQARQEYDRCRLLVRKAAREGRAVQAKVAYFKLARFARTTTDKLAAPPFVTSMLGGALLFAAFCFIALLITRSPGWVFGFGIVGFFGGCLLVLRMLSSTPDEVRTALVALEQWRSDQLGPLAEARQAYANARQRYNHLVELHKLRADCNAAAREQQRLMGEYQAMCDPADGTPAG